MYIPKSHEENDVSVLHALINNHPLGTWVTQDRQEIIINHIPFFLTQHRVRWARLMPILLKQPFPWQVSDAPQDFIHHLMKGVIGIKIPIVKLIGKWKVSQNKKHSDQMGVVAGLLAQNTDGSREMAKLVNQHIPSIIVRDR